MLIPRMLCLRHWGLNKNPRSHFRFGNIVKAQSPKMAKAKKWLVDHGQLLEEEI